jgi:hypothetical protein
MKRYVWPAGWLTLQQAANDLACLPEKVDTILKPSLDDGSVKKDHFMVWDTKLGRAMKKPGYKVAEKDDPTSKPKPAKHPDSEVSRGRGRPRKSSRVPVAGDALRTRAGKAGVLQLDGGVKWDDGTITRPNVKERFAKGDYKLIE